MWEKELNVAKAAAQEAGQAIMKIYDSPEIMQVDFKADRSPLTSADRAANDIIVTALRRDFPSYAILSEEDQDSLARLQNDFCFVVDPLDGTKEFIKRNGQFTVNIALAYRHKTVMGVIYVPVTRDLYHAAQGSGAFLVNERGEKTGLRVSERGLQDGLRVVKSNSHDSPILEDFLTRHNLTQCVRMGSSLKGCLVAAGEAELYYRYNPTMEWDTAAMQCIVEEAGGIFRQIDDSPMTYNREDSRNSKGFYCINRQENRLR